MVSLVEKYSIQSWGRGSASVSRSAREGGAGGAHLGHVLGRLVSDHVHVEDGVQRLRAQGLQSVGWRWVRRAELLRRPTLFLVKPPDAPSGRCARFSTCKQATRRSLPEGTDLPSCLPVSLSHLLLHQPDELRLLRPAQRFFLGFLPSLQPLFKLLRLRAENHKNPTLEARDKHRGNYGMATAPLPWRPTTHPRPARRPVGPPALWEALQEPPA